MEGICAFYVTDGRRQAELVARRILHMLIAWVSLSSHYRQVDRLFAIIAMGKTIYANHVIIDLKRYWASTSGDVREAATIQIIPLLPKLVVKKIDKRRTITLEFAAEAVAAYPDTCEKAARNVRCSRDTVKRICDKQLRLMVVLAPGEAARLTFGVTFKRRKAGIMSLPRRPGREPRSG